MRDYRNMKLLSSKTQIVLSFFFQTELFCSNKIIIKKSIWNLKKKTNLEGRSCGRRWWTRETVMASMQMVFAVRMSWAKRISQSRNSMIYKTDCYNSGQDIRTDAIRPVSLWRCLQVRCTPGRWLIRMSTWCQEDIRRMVLDKICKKKLQNVRLRKTKRWLDGKINTLKTIDAWCGRVFRGEQRQKKS